MDRSERAVRVALTTAPDLATATRIARSLVEERLAACVNVVPGLRSIYRWKGAVEDADEFLLIVKTCIDRLDELGARLRELHPYEVPELLSVSAAEGLAEYLDWVRAEVAP